MMRLKAAGVGGVTRSGLGTNSRTAAPTAGGERCVDVAEEGDAGVAVEVVEEVGDERDVVAFAKGSVEGAAGDEVMAVGDTGLLGVLGCDLKDFRPVDGVDLCFRVVARDGDAEQTVAGGDVEDLVNGSLFGKRGCEILRRHAHHGRHVTCEVDPNRIVGFEGIIDGAPASANRVGYVAVGFTVMVAGHEVCDAAHVGWRVAIEEDGAVLLEAVGAVELVEEALDGKVVAEVRTPRSLAFTSWAIEAASVAPSAIAVKMPRSSAAFMASVS